MARYWNPNQIPLLSSNPSGIKILEPGDEGFAFNDLDNFANDAGTALDLIYRTASGVTLLDSLAHAANDSVVISPGANMCGGCGQDARKAVAAELLATNTAVPGPATRNAVQSLFGDVPENALAQAINECPKFVIEGLPGAIAAGLLVPAWG